MATGSNGIATYQDCINKGITCSGYSNENQCVKFSDIVTPSAGTTTTTSVTITPKYTYTSYNSSTGACIVKTITTTLSAALPNAITIRYSAVNNATGSTVYKTGTIAAGSTTGTISYPYGSSTYVKLYSVTATPTITSGSDQRAFYNISNTTTLI